MTPLISEASLIRCLEHVYDSGFIDIVKPEHWARLGYPEERIIELKEKLKAGKSTKVDPDGHDEEVQG